MKIGRVQFDLGIPMSIGTALLVGWLMGFDAFGMALCVIIVVMVRWYVRSALCSTQKIHGLDRLSKRLSRRLRRLSTRLEISRDRS